MSALGIVAKLDNLGVNLIAEGDKIRCRAPKGVITAEIRHLISKHKAEILELLTLWPTECIEAERLFDHREARLYPLIDKRVVTPKGRGELWRVFTGSIGVVLDTDSDKVTFFENAEDIYPARE
ncbi:hypothetical protein MYX84_05180 [Acidobacteria bacterium AH-259-O06]|nr:hypothetical protein [Acidobacteria bacterium AH-259-O06]